MGKRFLILIGAAALGAAVMAAGASANFRSVDDPRGDTKCSHGDDFQPCSDSERRNADIVRATAGHDGTRLKHTIRVVGKFQQAELFINTDSDRDCELYVVARRGHGRSEFRECYGGPVSGSGRARMDFHRHSVKILFSERSIGNPQNYGWRVFAWTDATDIVPNRDHRYIGHRLRAPAPDRVQYDTELTITQDAPPGHPGLLGLLGGMTSEFGKCEGGRRVGVFKWRPVGADRKVGAATSHNAFWAVPPRFLKLQPGRHRLYVTVKPTGGDQYLCRADRSETITFHMPR